MGIKDKYNKLILDNAETVAQIEGILRTALYLVPGRFRNSELKAELAYTGVTLASLYHDYITAKSLLQRGVPTTPSGDPIPPPYCLNTAKWISFVQGVELLIEIFSKEKMGERGRWASVFVLELIKAMLRFKILYKTNGNILIHQGIPHRESSASPFQKIDKSFEDVMKSIPTPPGDKKQRKTLLDVQNEQKQAKSLKSLLAAEPTPNTLMALLPPPPPPNKASRLFGESLYILRPLIYLMAMYMYGKQSWRAWLLSLGSDLSSYYCLTYPDKLTKIEKVELRRRTFLWLYYLVRSPFFEAIAGESVVSKSLSKLQSVSLVKRALGPLFDYLMVYRQHYFYTSAS
eukprot:Phypoly_transcript_11780.p1 GENE.Phypoly_transcript_11780~~Phypoly_transcript_11780.p1  ORF type:complete len:345 (+),score=47.86 Phypoly_transcript_11780:101-1135(+)